jgi:hypothetical protein
MPLSQKEIDKVCKNLSSVTKGDNYKPPFVVEERNSSLPFVIYDDNDCMVAAFDSERVCHAFTRLLNGLTENG